MWRRKRGGTLTNRTLLQFGTSAHIAVVPAINYSFIRNFTLERNKGKGPAGAKRVESNCPQPINYNRTEAGTKTTPQE